MFGVAGCYPQCPPERPFFHEDTMKCVSYEQCGCYDGKNNHYDFGDEVEGENCQKWYVLNEEFSSVLSPVSIFFMYDNLKEQWKYFYDCVHYAVRNIDRLKENV